MYGEFFYYQDLIFKHRELVAALNRSWGIPHFLHSLQALAAKNMERTNTVSRWSIIICISDEALFHLLLELQMAVPGTQGCIDIHVVDARKVVSQPWPETTEQRISNSRESVGKAWMSIKSVYRGETTSFVGLVGQELIRISSWRTIDGE